MHVWVWMLEGDKDWHEENNYTNVLAIIVVISNDLYKKTTIQDIRIEILRHLQSKSYIFFGHHKVKRIRDKPKTSWTEKNVYVGNMKRK